MAARGKIVTAFKLHGLSLKSEASQFLGEALSTQDNIEEWLDKIIESVQKQPLTSTLVNKEIVETAVQECSETSNEDSDKAFCIINAFEVPRFKYNPDRKKFLQSTSKHIFLHGEAPSRSELFQDRYAIIYQRTLRHDIFAPVSSAAHPSQKTNKYELKPVEFLLGSTAKLGKIIVLGMIAQIKEGKYFLEDCTGVVEIDLSKAIYHTGLFTENCIVLAEGLFEDNIFHVDALGCPPSEPAHITRNYFGNINFFGGPSAIAVKASAKLHKTEKENVGAMFVILSDVFLDLPKVMEKLRTLFAGYSSMPPTLFVLCGNFLSEPYGGKRSKLLRESFNNLAALISEFEPLLESSRFVFVPGPQDPGPGNILPRPPIPTCLTREFQTKVPFAMFATNPCRMQYCTQEVVIFREDLVNKMCRNCIHLPNDLGEIPNHLVKTIISQAHLCPLPPHARPVYWSFDNALRLYPVPDLIILADKYHSYVQQTTVDCTCLNPIVFKSHILYIKNNQHQGSFSKNDYCFKVYWPATGEVEESKIQE